MFNIHPQTLYHVECRRNGVIVWAEDFPNLVTTVGKNKILDACFKTGEAANAWFVGIVDNAGWTAYAATDTMAAHAGWTEVTAYNEATRQAYVASVPSGGSTDNSANRAIFTMNAGKTIRGMFLADSSVKGGAAGTLYGVGDFSVSRAVINGDQVYAQATLTV